MDPTTISLTAASTIAILVPFLTKAGEKFAETIGEKLANLLYKKFEGQPEAKEALDKLKAVPDSPTLQAELQDQIEKVLATDETFAQALRALITEAKPTVGGDQIGIQVDVSGQGQVRDIVGKIVDGTDKGT